MTWFPAEIATKIAILEIGSRIRIRIRIRVLVT